jgi:septum formation topological specificity factor MinE
MNEIKELENLIDITCNYFKISKDDFKTKSRKRELSTARQMVGYIAIYKTNIRKRIVAKQLNRDRTGMYYYIKQHKSNMEGAGLYNKEYRKDYFEILKTYKKIELDKKQFLDTEEFNIFISKVNIKTYNIPDICIILQTKTTLDGVVEHHFFSDCFNFTDDITIIKNVFNEYKIKIKYKTYEG